MHTVVCNFVLNYFRFLSEVIITMTGSQTPLASQCKTLTVAQVITHTHRHRHTLTHTHTHTHSLTHSHTHTHTHSLTHSHTLTLTHTHTHSHTHTDTHTPFSVLIISYCPCGPNHSS